MVRAACHRALMARERILQGYPDWQAWRRQAREIKAEAISRLDELLPRLAREVQAWGGKVLWARDAAQARELILGLAREHRVTMVTKSKSMTTEEIGLNPALTAAGIPTLETDLGEFIVQLAGASSGAPHRPGPAPGSPADRRPLSRSDLGMACPPDPEALTRLACGHLQPHFWQAGMGITGVNFAAARTAPWYSWRMRATCASPPPCRGCRWRSWGWKRLFPALGDVEVLLRLLPASATGQRLTALVHFLRGRKFQPEGPQTFYLIILDNGRRRLARDPEFREALYCLRCGACLNVCPVFQLRAAHLYRRVYPGAIGILLAPHLAPVGDLSDLCSQCGACQEICPVGISLAENILKERARSRRFRTLRALSGLAGQALVRPRLYRSLEPGLRFLQTRVPGLQQPPWSALRLSPESFQRRRRPRAAPREPHPGPGAGGRSRPGLLPLDNRGGQARWSGRERRRHYGSAHPGSPPGGGGGHLPAGPGSGPTGPAAGAVARTLVVSGPSLALPGRPGAETAGVVAAPGQAPTGPHRARPRSSWAWGLSPRPAASSLRPPPGRRRPSPSGCRELVVIVPQEAAGLSLAQALDLVARQAPGMISWLTGPSRTADIEKVLVLGAQGPREFQVVLYQPEE